jgi:glycosyltransferase involved in cell wall biosynthesis
MTKLIGIKNHRVKTSYSEDISIVMPVYNHESTVAEAIESALMQEMPYKSVIHCLNDASTDKSGEILDRYRQKYPDKIRVYTSNENQGCGKKSFYHNRPSVNGRYWCLLAGDDYWISKGKLYKQISFLDENVDYVGCSCNTVMKNEVTGKESVIKPYRNTWNLLDLLLLKERYAFYVHASSIIWRNIFLIEGFFLPPAFKKRSASGDVILMHLMLSTGAKMFNLMEEMSCYRVTGQGIWSKISEEDKKQINRTLVKRINSLIPVKYKIIIYLQSLRRHSKILRTLIPGSLNE